MAIRKMNIGFVMIVASLLWTRVMAQSNGGCTSAIITMSPCLSYITGNSSTPSSGCCTQLDNVVRSSPQCLCQVLNGGGSSFGLNINQTLALALPGVCKVQTPPISSCDATSQANPPTASSDSPNNTPSGSGSKTDDGTSAGSSSKLSASLLFFLLFAASYTLAFSTIS